MPVRFVFQSATLCTLAVMVSGSPAGAQSRWTTLTCMDMVRVDVDIAHTSKREDGTLRTLLRWNYEADAGLDDAFRPEYVVEHADVDCARSGVRVLAATLMVEDGTGTLVPAPATTSSLEEPERSSNTIDKLCRLALR